MDGEKLIKQTLDQIPQVNSNAKRIVALIKEGGRVTGYQLSDNSIVEKQQAVDLAKQGQIAGVGIAHRGDTEYLKSIPDGREKGDMVKLKKYFYVLRPILACRWILEKQTPPPMLFSTLADACLDEALVPAVTDLLRLKMETPEIGLGPRIDVINDYLDASIEDID